MTLGLFREDLSLQENGAPFECGDSIFYVRRSGTEGYWKKRREITAALFGLYLQPKPEHEAVILANMLCEYTVVGWDSVYDEEGEGVEIEYSLGNARKIFLNKEYFLSLNKMIENFSWDFSGYAHKLAEDDLEDLKKK